MVRGFYSAAAGVFSQQKALNVISNNISNVSTAGFKGQNIVESSFGEHFVSRLHSINQEPDRIIGSGAFLTVNLSSYTDFTQGALEHTGKTTDMAIDGEGFFLVERDGYGQVLTRNGQFQIDHDGYLVLPGVGKVLNDHRNAIRLESSSFLVSVEGSIQEDGKETDVLYIALPREGSELVETSDCVFESKGGYDRADTKDYKIIQESIEQSNISIVREMSRIIAGQNHFQSCIQIIKFYDKINELSVNQIGRLG